MPDFERYHGEQLPELMRSGRSALLEGMTLPPLTLTVGDSSYTYRLDERGLRVVPGVHSPRLQVELSAGDWSGLVEDLESVPGILYGDRLLSHQGETDVLFAWEPALRALYTGRPLYPAGELRLCDGRGEPIDPQRSFTLAEDEAAMKEFLQRCGYLLVRDVFDGEELSAMRRAATEVATAAVEGDQQSWWGKRQDGGPVLCRVLSAGRHPGFAGLYDDPRMRSLAGILPPGMRHPAPGETDAVTVIFKNHGVSEGLSDLPWHRDCGMGGHAVMCPTYVVSIYLYDATPGAGCLQFLPGSQQFCMGFLDASKGDLPGAVTVPAKAGDVTVHVGDVMHAAPPPRDPDGEFRQSILLSYHPDFENHRGERHYNDVLLGSRDGQVGSRS